MAFQDIFEDDGGRRVSPEVDGDWSRWVGASRTRSFCDGVAIVDWLNLYGAEKGFVPAVDEPGYDARTDFLEFLFEKGHAFEAAVIAHLETLVAVTHIERDDDGTRSLASAVATWDAMVSGAEFIYQGVLRNPQNLTYGAPDFLVRSDVLRRLFPEATSEEDAGIRAPALPGPWHYRVVDAKFTTLHLDKTGHIKSESRPYMVQVYLYNRALGRIQGYEPPSGYLLGRGWEQGVEEGVARRGDSCMERLARVDMEYTAPNGRFCLATLADQSLEWLARVRREGASWQALPVPSVPELRPNYGGDYGPWQAAARSIARELGDITMAWFAGVPARENAMAKGIDRWDDPRCTAEAMEITGPCLAPMVDRVIAVNRSSEGPAIVPQVIRAEVEAWARPGPVEFFVDFETVNSLDDDFTRIPLQNGSPRIFMVGCGHIEDGDWKFASFVAEDLGSEAEARVIGAWLAHMEAVRARLAPGYTPLVFHWSPAEVSVMSAAYNSARERHKPKSLRWPEPNWFDFLGLVMKAKGDHVVVRGAMGFGLKAVARALHEQGLVETVWGDTITDGMGAMVGAWWCNREAATQGVSMATLPLMEEIAKYNEVDCRVMWETISALRPRASVKGEE